MAPSICHLSWGGAGYRVLPWSDPMIRVVGPWISCCSCWALDPLCCCIRQGPIRLSSACGTFPRLVRCRVAAAKRVSSLLSSSAGVFSDPPLPAAMAMPPGLCLSICARSLPHEWRPSLPTRALTRIGIACTRGDVWACVDAQHLPRSTWALFLCCDRPRFFRGLLGYLVQRWLCF